MGSTSCSPPECPCSTSAHAGQHSCQLSGSSWGLGVPAEIQAVGTGAGKSCAPVCVTKTERAPRAPWAVCRLTYQQPQLMGIKTETKLWVISFWCGLCVLFPFIADGYFSCRRLSCKLENVFLDVCHYGPDGNEYEKWVWIFVCLFLIKWFVLVLLEVWGCWVMLCYALRSLLAKLITRQAFGIKCILSSEASV